MIETPFKTPLNEAFAMSDRHAVQRLRAENERLREALKDAERTLNRPHKLPDGETIARRKVLKIIRAALGESNG